jgi:hypothetical protein
LGFIGYKVNRVRGGPGGPRGPRNNNNNTNNNDARDNNNNSTGTRPNRSGKEPAVGGEPVSDTTITLSVPDELIGNIFGRQGATMREIIALSGAKIVVSPRNEFIPGTNNRLVTITGSPTAAQTAHLFITQRLHVSYYCDYYYMID